jgi:hypothetical protein
LVEVATEFVELKQLVFVDGARVDQLLPGKEQIELNAENTAAATEGASSTDGYRPPWVPMEYMPRLAPFQVGDHVFLEPRVQEVETDSYRLPWTVAGYGLTTRTRTTADDTSPRGIPDRSAPGCYAFVLADL